MTPDPIPAESEDARMRMLFAEAPRPPMGDEAFVVAVMGRVEEARASDKVRRQAVTLGAVALAGAVLWPFKGPIEAALSLTATRFAGDLSAFGGGASALLIAAAASLAAWAYAERG